MSIRKLASTIAVIGLLGLGAQTCSAFSLGGPALGFQSGNFGYGRLGLSLVRVGALTYNAQNLGEEYRINVPTIYYTYDNSFLDYFGAKGVQEIDKAVAYFNEIPPYSSMSANLGEIPEDATRENFKAGALQLTDLKSYAMYAIMAQLGLVSPEVHVWDVQSRVIPNGAACPVYNFYVIKRNFDPVTWEPTSYVNGTLYTLSWLISCTPDFSYVDPVPVDPLAYTYRSVAGANAVDGFYLTGLTRDDIGGLRYIYRPDNYNREQLPPDVFAGLGGSGGSPWLPVVSTNTGIGAGDTTALRSGIDQLKFVRHDYDSLMGTFFQGLTNNFTVQVVTNSGVVNQSFSRAVLQPDMIFSAGFEPIDVGGGFTVLTSTDPQTQSINAGGTVNGPGSLVIGNSRGSIDIRFQKVGPFFRASSPSFLSEASLAPVWRWGSFDGTTNEPVLYPSGASIKELERSVLGR